MLRFAITASKRPSVSEKNATSAEKTKVTPIAW
jgi:hypothetical protein